MKPTEDDTLKNKRRLEHSKEKGGWSAGGKILDSEVTGKEKDQGKITNKRKHKLRLNQKAHALKTVDG